VFRESHSCDSGLAIRTPSRKALPPSTSLYQWREGARCQSGSFPELCGLRVSVESYVAPKHPPLCKRCQRFGHMQRNCGYAPWCFAFGGSLLSGGCCNPRDQPQFCGCGETTQQNTVAMRSRRKRRRLLQTKRPNSAERVSPQANEPPLNVSGPVPLPSRWTWARGGITSSEVGVS